MYRKSRFFFEEQYFAIDLIGSQAKCFHPKSVILQLYWLTTKEILQVLWCMAELSVLHSIGRKIKLGNGMASLGNIRALWL